MDFKEYFQFEIKEIEADKIEEIKDFPIGERILHKQDEVSGYHETFLWRHEYVQAGISDANVLALFYTIKVSHNVPLDKYKLQKYITEYFINDFGKKNVLTLSFSEREDGYLYYCLAYPLSRRILDPRQWTFRGKPIPAKEDDFFTNLEYAFGLKEKKTDVEKYILDDIRELDDMKEKEYITTISTSSSQTDMPYEDISKVYKSVYNYMKTNDGHMFREAQHYEIRPETFLNAASQYMGRAYKDRLTEKDKCYIINELFNAVYKYHVLTPLIKDPVIMDIKVLNYNKIRVKANGERQTSNLQFDSMEDYVSFVEGIAYRNNIDISAAAMSHFVDDSDEDFLLRVNITTTYVASNPVPYMHIRKIAKNKPSINYLIEHKMITKELALWLIDKAKNSRGMIFVGKGGSGKTTLMNVLLEYIPYSRSVLVSQDNPELFSNNHPDMMFYHTVEAQGYNANYPVYDLKDISKNGLLVDIDYFIIGEIKGAEAMYFLNASFTGAQCWASLHSGVPTLDKLADYVMYESKYNRKQALSMLQNLQYVIYMDHFQVQEITEVFPWSDELDNLRYETVYTHQKGFAKQFEKGVS